MKIAITGSFGAGKSTVSALIRQHGYTVYDCDQICKSYYLKDSILYEQLVEYFKEYHCLDTQGNIDVSIVKDIFFKNQLLKDNVTQLMYQQLQQFIIQYQQSPLIMEVPLLFETHFESYFDIVLCVTSDESISIERLNQYRGYNKDDFQTRMKYQYDIDYKIVHSDDIISNNGDIKDLKKQVDLWIKKRLVSLEMTNIK